MPMALLQVCKSAGLQVIKLVIKAGQAKPGPPVGAALGQAGLKIMDFVKDFNAATAGLKASVVQRLGSKCKPRITFWMTVRCSMHILARTVRISVRVLNLDRPMSGYVRSGCVQLLQGSQLT